MSVRNNKLCNFCSWPDIIREIKWWLLRQLAATSRLRNEWTILAEESERNNKN
jgi:hypothetical protein